MPGGWARLGESQHMSNVLSLLRMTSRNSVVSVDPGRPALSASVMPRPSPSAIVLIVLVIMAGVGYDNAVASLWKLWTSSPPYDHGLLVLGICAFLAYRNWLEASPPIVPRAAPGISLLILPCSVIWALGHLTQTTTLQQVSFVVLLFLLTTGILGRRAARAFAVPVGLIVFTLPLWDPLVAPMQAWYTAAVTALLNLTGVPAVADGTDIWVSAGTFSVRPGCVGLAQVIVAGTIGFVFSHLGRLGRWSSFGVVIGAIAAALVANLFRIYATVLLGQMHGMDSFLIAEHWAQGWLFFALGMMLYFFAIRSVGADAAPLAYPPVSAPQGQILPSRQRLTFAAAVCCAALSAGPLMILVMEAGRADARPVSLELPTQLGAWQAKPVHGADGFRPEFTGADVERERTYVQGEASVDVYVARSEYRSEGREAITLNGGFWILGSWHALGTRTRDLGNGASVLETEVRSTSGARKLLWHWYFVHGRAVSNVYLAKMVSAWGMLRGDRSAAVVVVATNLAHADNSGRAEADLRKFVSDAKSAIEKHIEQTAR